ncbi:hypothetical protein FACS1894163_10840 [Spirochaetia bacterium]|nr:hypothetical protein FACS1894163_10840 [Spirochaetia bacterium]
MSDPDLKKECFKYARQSFQGKRFTNKETGREIIVSKDGLEEWKNKSKSREQILSIKNYGYKYYHHYLEDIKIEPRSGITRPAGETG